MNPYKPGLLTIFVLLLTADLKVQLSGFQSSVNELDTYLEVIRKSKGFNGDEILVERDEQKLNVNNMAVTGLLAENMGRTFLFKKLR
jgi:hypothetical protein